MKKGDKVRCIIPKSGSYANCPGEGITVGKIYTLLSGPDDPVFQVHIIEDNGKENRWKADFFELITIPIAKSCCCDEYYNILGIPFTHHK